MNYALHCEAINTGYCIFYGQNVIIIAHGLMKEKRIPKEDIQLALDRKKMFEINPKEHTFILGNENEPN